MEPATYYTLSSHEIEAALYNGLIQFHANGESVGCRWVKYGVHLLWNAVHQETAHTIVSIVNSDQMAGFVQLIGTSQACRT
jgi:hypothetical protein